MKNQEPNTGAAKLDLRATFAPHSREEWRAAAEELLKGASFEKALRTQTIEGITLEPMYRREDIENLPHISDAPGLGGRARGAQPEGYLKQGWEISQELPYGTPASFNRAALLDLSRGQTELNIPLDLATRTGQDPDQAAPGRVGACGLSLSTVTDLERALQGVHLDMISLYFRCGSSGLPVAALLFALARKKGLPLEKLRGCIEIDPLSSLARLGRISVNLDRAFDEMALVTAYAGAHAPALQTIGVSGDPWHDGGASAVDELGFALASAVQYLKALSARGVPPEVAAPRIRFALSVGSNYFMEIAKFRAARILWSRILEAWGLDAQAVPMHLHARSSIWNKSVLDAHTNMLRTTTEAFSAAVGGANSMHVSPWDEVFSVPDDISRRIARNQQIILQEECELTRTVDPAGGSYYVEWLTDQVASRAWAAFQDVEKAGGMVEALKVGMPQQRVAKTREERLKRVQQRRDSLVGVNMYPNATEKRLTPRIPDYEAIYRERSREIQAYRTGADIARDTRIMDALNSLLDAAGDTTVEKAVEAASEGATLGEISRTLRRGMGEVTQISERVPLTRASQEFEQLRSAAAAYADGKGHPPQILQANMGPSRFYRVRADWTAAFFQAGGFQVLGERDFNTPEEVASAADYTGAPIVVITSTDETYAQVVIPLARALKALQVPPVVLVAGAPGENEAAFREAGVDDFVNVRSNNYAMNKRLLESIGVL